MGKFTIILTQKELNEILAKHFKIDSKDITYAGWSGILSFGSFLIQYQGVGKE